MTNILDYLEGHRFRKISDRIFCLQNSTHNNIRQSTIDILKPLADDLHDQLDTHKIKNLIYYVSYGYEFSHYNDTIQLKKQIYDLQTATFIKEAGYETILMTMFAGYIERKDWSKHRYGYGQSGKGTTIDRVILKDTYAAFQKNAENQHRDDMNKIDELHRPLLQKIDDKYSKLRDFLYKRIDVEKEPIEKDIQKSKSKYELAIKKLAKAKDNYNNIIENETYRFTKGYKQLQPLKMTDDEE
jgi:hypothetical protein